MRDFMEALADCNQALEIESAHFKTLLCKGKILLSLNRYGLSLDCFKLAFLDSQASLDCESINGCLEKCKKLEFLSRTGAFYLSDWVLNGFGGKSSELGEYIGVVEIKSHEMPPNPCLIGNLSAGDEDGLEVPNIGLFRPEVKDGSSFSNEKLDMGKIESILDVNSLVEESTSLKVSGKNKGYHGVGLWILASFINHSCNPNARLFHIGDYTIIHASRDIKAGEEVTFAYFDVLLPLSSCREMAKTFGCKRCKFEGGGCGKQEMREIERGIERGLEVRGMVYQLEEWDEEMDGDGKGKGLFEGIFLGIVQGNEEVGKADSGSGGGGGWCGGSGGKQ
ncbi:Histone-lysine N-methyltransferase [Actinidia chinensis var. chinensis]|uniref:Histone-lysine N-methyltransferase n=1 Tax=Actinidia chinensis var. chinensis TaxID=1590841 RepID=A0A2R6PBR8_ACTCC|nr:Histone-lysine N-methyltransferase [Actinidia chinensis var. chinensis]